MVWMPNERVLCRGCAVRAGAAGSLGNTAHADLVSWPDAIDRALNRYGNALIVVPGHGASGDAALLRHTLELLRP
ncbi:MAG: hypothetical protein ABIZ91_09480 [Gemmatimonadaceae bacterium]